MNSVTTLQTLIVNKELSEILDFAIRRGKGIFELKLKYTVLKEISVNGKRKVKGDAVYFNSTEAKKVFNSVKKNPDQEELQETIRKIKQYIDFRGSLNIPEITFSPDFTKIRIS